MPVLGSPVISSVASYATTGGSLLGNTLYTYQVEAWAWADTGYSNSPLSTAVGTTTAIGTNTNKLLVKWAPVANADGYAVYRYLVGQPPRLIYSRPWMWHDGSRTGIEYFLDGADIALIDEGKALGDEYGNSLGEFRSVFGTGDPIVGRRGYGELVFFASGNTIAPTISNFSPAASTPISISQVLSFDIDDDSTIFRRILLKASFAISDGWDLVHDGDSFGPNYQGASNVRTATATGYSYTILRDGGWTIGDAPILTPYAIDESGNENV